MANPSVRPATSESGPVHDLRKSSERGSSASLAERIAMVRSLREAIVGRLDSVVRAVREDAEKVVTEALLTDVLPTLEQLRYYERVAPKVLRRKSRVGSLLFLGGNAYVEYLPYGVVLIVVPWNNPFQLALVPAVTALLCGNAVVLKPSERTPNVAAELRTCFEAAGIGASLVRIIEGGPKTVRALVSEQPDLVFFTGGTVGGREVLRLAAEHLIPTVLELGGKDPMIVFADADLERAAHAAVYGAFAHDGQHCISVERLYVERPVYDRMATAVATGASRLVRGRDLAERVMPQALERVQRQIASSLETGARLLTAREDGFPVLPAVVTDARHDMPIMREESFGPLLAVMPFDGEAKAVALANDSQFGLNASVWTKDQDKARRVASQLESGCVCINDVLVNAGHPSLPFGGVKHSGFGRYHGPEGLLAFVQPKAVFGRRQPGPQELNWFPYDDNLCATTEELIRLRYGKKEGLLSRLRRWRILGRRRSSRLGKLSVDRLLDSGEDEVDGGAAT